MIWPNDDLVGTYVTPKTYFLQACCAMLDLRLKQTPGSSLKALGTLIMKATIRDWILSRAPAKAEETTNTNETNLRISEHSSGLETPKNVSTIPEPLHQTANGTAGNAERWRYAAAPLKDTSQRRLYKSWTTPYENSPDLSNNYRGTTFSRISPICVRVIRDYNMLSQKTGV